MDAGDFSGVTDSNGNMIPIYDPATTTLVGGNYTRETFTQEYNEGPGNTALCGGHVNCIPASRFNAISKLYLPLIPTGSTTVVNGSNLFYP